MAILLVVGDQSRVGSAETVAFLTIAREWSQIPLAPMKRSTDRILTTHTGSLPRPPDLAGMLDALDTGAATDPAALEVRVRHAVGDIVRQQVDAGVDVVS